MTLAHVPAVREAADGIDEQIYTQLIIPVPPRTCPMRCRIEGRSLYEMQCITAS